MKRAQTIDEFRAMRRELKGRVAFVPTLGAMHHGHEALLRRGKEAADNLVVSIFLNPLQFGPNEDLDTYPVNMAGDLEICERHGVALVFTPTPAEIYPEDKAHRDLLTHVTVDRLPQFLCGANRPGHFRGVTTIVAKLFNIVQPDVAVFGEKDYQQLAILRRMVKDLAFPVDILSQPTVRDDDGLAVSSRNLRLTPPERALAPLIYQGLTAARDAYRNGLHSPRELEEIVRDKLASENAFSVEYIRCIDGVTLESVEEDLEVVDGRSVQRGVIAVAAHLGSVRLIDNIILDD